MNGVFFPLCSVFGSVDVLQTLCAVLQSIFTFPAITRLLIGWVEDSGGHFVQKFGKLEFVAAVLPGGAGRLLALLADVRGGGTEAEIGLSSLIPQKHLVCVLSLKTQRGKFRNLCGVQTRRSGGWASNWKRSLGSSLKFFCFLGSMKVCLLRIWGEVHQKEFHELKNKNVISGYCEEEELGW